MSDLRVKTHVLLSTALELTGVSNAAHALADSHVRAASLCPALGFDEPAQAADSFLNSWAYGVRQIASQAEQLGRDLRTSADTFAVIEARLAQAAGGAAFEPVLSAPPATPVEPPLPMVRHWTGVIAPPVQLAHATRADQIIPGDPEQVRLLLRLVAGFAEEAHQTRDLLMRSDLGGWTGAAAQAVEAELHELLENLLKATEAFENAAGALSGYAFALEDAQAEVRQAIGLWQSAIRASEVARGVAVGPAPVDAPADPDAVLARAGAMTQDALARIRLAGKTLATVLHEAKEGAPKDPSFWAHVRRAVASFGLGLSESVTGIAEGAVVVGELVRNLNPARAIYDPDGYVAAQEALYAGLGHALANPDKVAAGMLNLHELRENPARWAGEFLPDVLAIGAAGRGLAMAKEAEGLGQLTTAGEAVEAAKIEAGGEFEFAKVSRAVANKTITDLGVDPTSLIGKAMRQDLAPPFGRVNRWETTHLQEGTRVAVLNGGRAVVPVYGELPMNGSKFFEDLQLYGERTMLSDGTPGPPRVDGTIKIFEIRSPGGVDAARAIAEANTQFGGGGGTRLFIPDVNRAMADGRLIEVDHHHFDPMTLRTAYEDPAYRTIDPNLPVQALDPRHEKFVGLRTGLQEKGWETVEDKAKTAAMAGAARATEESEQ